MTGPTRSYGKYDSNGSPKAMVLSAAAHMTWFFDHALTRELRTFHEGGVKGDRASVRRGGVRQANNIARVLKHVRSGDMDALEKALDDEVVCWQAFYVAMGRDVLNLTKDELLRTFGVHQKNGCPVLADVLREKPRIAPGATS